MIVLAIDPGVESPGYAVWDSEASGGAGSPIYVGAECPRALAVDAVVVESGFIGRIGLKGMWGLGFGAGYRLAEAVSDVEAWGSAIDGRVYTIRPDGAAGWRAALPARAGRHAKFDGLPKDVVVARLRVRYGVHVEPGYTDDMIEAMGIAEAAAAILARPKAKDRRALKVVKFK